MPVFVEQYNLGMCKSWVNSLYTLCVIIMKWQLLLQVTRSQSIWRQLEELQVYYKDESSTSCYEQVYSIVSPAYSHLGTVSSSHSPACLTCSQSIVHGYLLVRVVLTILSALFLSIITGVLVLGFRSSSVTVTHEG